MPTETIIPEAKGPKGQEYYRVYDKHMIKIDEKGKTSCDCMDGTMQEARGQEARCKHRKAVEQYKKNPPKIIEQEDRWHGRLCICDRCLDESPAR